MSMNMANGQPNHGNILGLSEYRLCYLSIPMDYITSKIIIFPGKMVVSGYNIYIYACIYVYILFLLGVVGSPVAPDMG